MSAPASAARRASSSLSAWLTTGRPRAWARAAAAASASSVELRRAGHRQLDRRGPEPGQLIDRGHRGGRVGALDPIAVRAPALGRVAELRGDHRPGGEHPQRVHIDAEDRHRRRQVHRARDPARHELRPRRRIDQMHVAVDEGRRDPAPAEVDHRVTGARLQLAQRVDLAVDDADVRDPETDHVPVRKQQALGGAAARARLARAPGLTAARARAPAAGRGRRAARAARRRARFAGARRPLGGTTAEHHHQQSPGSHPWTTPALF
jgi:hypothetical protein